MKQALKTPKKDAMERHLRGILIDRIQNRDSLKNSVEEILDFIIERFHHPDTAVANAWSITDVQAIRPELTDTEAMQVLIAAQEQQEAGIGIDGTQIAFCAEELFGGYVGLGWP